MSNDGRAPSDYAYTSRASRRDCFQESTSHADSRPRASLSWPDLSERMTAATVCAAVASQAERGSSTPQ